MSARQGGRMKPAAVENQHERRDLGKGLKHEDEDWRWYAYVLAALVGSGLALAAMVFFAA